VIMGLPDRLGNLNYAARGRVTLCRGSQARGPGAVGVAAPAGGLGESMRSGRVVQCSYGRAAIAVSSRTTSSNCRDAFRLFAYMTPTQLHRPNSAMLTQISYMMTFSRGLARAWTPPSAA